MDVGQLLAASEAPLWREMEERGEKHPQRVVRRRGGRWHRLGVVWRCWYLYK
ncbi:hypothetical protein IEO21_11135 [Rhodonia placenta]|uniref:Uncharacterized protein n=1 Tax=Rhodonia placenta TaxID=104341 RepID=A0A8H7TWU8_9APHY|nr:hypothetical protein IEO21_11135 [Postia placenta]